MEDSNDVFPCRQCGTHVHEDELGECESCKLGDLCTKCSGFDGHVCIDCAGEEDTIVERPLGRATVPTGQDPDDEDFKP